MSTTNAFLEGLFSLHNRVALVTGASSGIGRAIAVGLAKAGAHVALQGRSQERLHETAHQIEKANGSASLFPADLADETACRHIVEQVVRRCGHIDILINNAGMNRRNPMACATPHEFEEVMTVNLKAPFLLSQAAYPFLKASGNGKVVLVGSITSVWGLGGVGVYGMSKAALLQLTRTLAVEWARDNIQVNCLIPGFILTPLTEESIWGDQKRRRWLTERIPMGRPGQPEELVGAVVYLCSPASSYTTGQAFVVDGGFLAGGWWDNGEETRENDP